MIRKAAAWEDAFFGPIEDAMAEQALAEAREDDGYDLTGASPFWRYVICQRCGRSWQPRCAVPKQCRWCKSRGWATPAGSIPLGRPRSQPRLKAMKKAKRTMKER